MNKQLIKNSTRHLIFFFFMGLYITANGQVPENLSVYEQGDLEKLLSQAESFRLKEPKKAISLFEECKAHYYSKQDTLGVIIVLEKLSNLYANLANYDKSYDGYWEALILAEQLENESAKASIYNGLGWLYSFFGRKKIAEEYFNKAININKKLLQQTPQNRQMLLDNYYAMVTLHRKENELFQARLYLDSCKMLQDPNSDQIFLKAELGYILTKEQKYKEAEEILLEVKASFEQRDSSYLIILYPFLGDVYMNMGDLNTSEKLYLDALSIADVFKSHLDLIPNILEKLAEVYHLKGLNEKAYNEMKEAKLLNENQFGSRSQHNQRLLEIKDIYRIEMERQEQLIDEQRLTFLEQQHKIGELRSYLLAGTIVFLIVVGFIFYRFLRTRYKAEKKLLRQKQQLEMQKKEEVLVVKNKELTSSALQAIEKEELLVETKEELLKQKDNPDPKEINKIIKKIDRSTNLSWDEFELRFLAVNQDFYDKLRSGFPNLSQNDHKLCALIKLNFSSKDMAKLLGITVESVHTSRYRIRKKMELDRSTNLEDFIAKL
ncbi:tetratricopeptide repeat protein [Flammeovirgaceae bacterium SG7u.111]|nr:tetratricopeptide repeat protein [Flammeovirgaceae bacterium SG7u.132]WPO33663.1 tetratricopeptide repeat protein [Flammeovirgaceae bacterium SG7u.111]